MLFDSSPLVADSSLTSVLRCVMLCAVLSDETPLSALLSMTASTFSLFMFTVILLAQVLLVFTQHQVILNLP